MGLTEEDVDRFADKAEIRFRKVLDEHTEKVHAPLVERMGKLEGKFKFWGGGLALASFLLLLFAELARH